MQIKVVMLKTVTDPVCTCPVREAGLGSRILVPALPRAGEGAPRAHHVGGVMSQQRGPRQAQGAVASSAELTQGCVGWPHCLALLPPPFLPLGPVGKSYLVCLLPSANGKAVPAPHRCEEGVTFSHLTLSGGKT